MGRKHTHTHSIKLDWPQFKVVFRVLKLDDQTLLHLRVKGIANDLHRCAGDGGRGVCSSDVHYLVQKPVSAAEMQFTHATRSPRASQIREESYLGVRQTLSVELAHGTVLRWRNRFFNWYLKSCAVQQRP